MIRQQQLQLQQLQLQQQQGQPSSAVVDDTNLTPNSERSHHQFPVIPPLPTPGVSRSSTVHSHSHSPFSTRRGSRGSETAPLPHLSSTGDSSVFDLNDLVDRERQPESSAARRGSLDDGAYYQAQVDSLNRDNRMLRARIRVLERQIAELSASSSSYASSGGAAVASTENTTAVTSNAGAGDAAAAPDEPQATEKNVTG